MRDAVASGSPIGKQLDESMKRGELVSLTVVLKLIKEAMIKAAFRGSKGFLIDGYPREVDQGRKFEDAIKPCDKVSAMTLLTMIYYLRTKIALMIVAL